MKSTAAQFTSDARRETSFSSRILGTTQGKGILWVDINPSEFGVGETVHYSPLSLSLLQETETIET